jgi:phosphoribosyl-dephospho-CoA transferase
MVNNAMTSTARAHDLLFFHTAGLRSAPPAWATPAWLAVAPAVVRRDRDANWIPVGLRGATRSERHQAWLSPEALIRRVTPEALADAVVNGALDEQLADGLANGLAERSGTGIARLPALQALMQLAPMLLDIGLAWGPTGGVGFALASALPVLRESSDLDLLVRSPLPLTGEQHRSLLRLCAATKCRVDLQVETGQGGFAFAEWARECSHGNVSPCILLKTAAGPLLTDDPWRNIDEASADDRRNRTGNAGEGGAA